MNCKGRIFKNKVYFYLQPGIVSYVLEINIGQLSLFAVIGFEVPQRYIVGYALDYNERFRDLNVSILFDKSIRYPLIDNYNVDYGMFL